MNHNASPVPFKAESPRPLMRKLSDPAPYPVEALADLQPVVEAIQGMTQAPIAIPAGSALAVASLAVQGFADVETLGGARPVSLYVLTIAGSGSRKTACDAPLIHAFMERERDQATEYQEQLTSYNNRLALWKGEREQVFATAKKAKFRNKIEHEADMRALGKEPAPPLKPSRISKEPTTEGLTKLFMEGLPSLGILSDEGAQFLGGHGMNADNRLKTLAALNDLWQGNPITRTRSGDGHITLYGRRLAISLMVQNRVARQFMADPMTADIGFLPRFLISEPTSTIGTRFHANARTNQPALDRYNERMREIISEPMPMDAETFELKPNLLKLTQDARELLIVFSDDIERQQGRGQPLEHVTGYASKIAEQACRIAGVLTLFNSLTAEYITDETIQKAITLARYYLGEAVRISDAAIVSPETERAELLRVWMRDKWKSDEIVVAEIVQNAPNKLRETKKVRAALAELQTHGWIEPLPAGTVIRGKARKDAWRIIRDYSQE